MRKTVLIALTAISLILGASTLASAAPTASYKVTIATSTANSQAGKFITVSGKVTGPKAAGKTVKIQRKYVGGAWTTITNAVIKADGKYAARVETPRGGSTSFRAIKAKSTVRKAGTSPTKTIKVLEWLYLANESGLLLNGGLDGPMVQEINGVSYQRSMGFYDGDSSIYYKLKGVACTKFISRVGYKSSAVPEASPMTFHLGRANVGDDVVVTKSVPLGTSVTVTSSLVGTQFFQVVMDDLDSDNVGALGNPRILCNADHLPSFDNSDF